MVIHHGNAFVLLRHHTHAHARTSHTYSLTYELNGLQEPAADVFFMVVLHGNTLVLVRPLEVVGTVGGHVQQGGDPYAVQNLFLWGVEGAAKVEEREDLDRAALGGKTQMGGWWLINYFVINQQQRERDFLFRCSWFIIHSFTQFIESHKEASPDPNLTWRAMLDIINFKWKTAYMTKTKNSLSRCAAAEARYQMTSL